MSSLAFLLTSAVVVLVPGTGAIYSVSTGLTHGRKASVYAALGCTAGVIPHLLATVLGLAALMHTSSVAYQALKYAGAAYLFYTAYRTFKDDNRLAIQGVGKSTAAGLVLKGFALNILNPKLTIFFVAFLPQFVDADAKEPLAQMLGLSAVFMAMTLVVFCGYGFVAHAFRRFVIDSSRVQRALRYVFSGTFVALGVRLATVDG